MLDTESLRVAAAQNLSRYIDREPGQHANHPIAMMAYHRGIGLCETIAEVEGLPVMLVVNQSLRAAHQIAIAA